MEMLARISRAPPLNLVLRGSTRALRLGVWLALIYMTAAVLGALIPAPTARAPATGGPPVQVLLVAGPIHYDFLLPADPQTRAAFGFAQSAGVPITHPDVHWIVVGWGARGFYTTAGVYSDLSLGTIRRSTVGDQAVLRVDAAGPLPPDANVRKLSLSQDAYRALRDEILASLEPERKPLSVPGLGPTDRFFAATGRFDAFRTCNQWVSRRLAGAGLTMGAWTPTPFALRLSLWWNDHL